MILPTQEYMRQFASHINWHGPDYFHEIWKNDPKITLPWPTVLKKEIVHQKTLEQGITIFDIKNYQTSFGCHNEIDRLVNAVYEVGLVIQVPRYCTTTISLADIFPNAAIAKIIIIIQEGAKVTCIDSRPIDSLLCESVEIQLGKAAQLQYIDHRCTSAKSSLLQSFVMSADEYSSGTFYSMQHAAHYSKLFVRAELIGVQAQVTMKFGVHTVGTYYHSIITDQYHSAPYTLSRCTMKAAQHDAHTMYHGRIVIEKTGVQSQAFQEHKALLLNSTARAYARPTLEVMTNDVQCGHGSAIGILDQEQWWYLQSRGLNRHQAEQLLIQSFLQEILPT